MASKTLGQAVSAGLAELKEPVIAAFTATNQLQNVLISEVNERITYMLARVRSAYRWTLNRTTLTTDATMTTGTVTVTNGSVTVTSSATPWSTSYAGRYFRKTGDLTSYLISSATTSALTLATAYIGTGGSGASYTILHDVYAVSTANFDELKAATYGQAQTWASGITGRINTDQVGIVDLQTILDAAAGDLHADASGRPRLVAQIEPDASGYPQFLFWPYPGSDQLLFELWNARKYSEASAFSASLLSGEAPDIAYDVIYHGVRARACMFDRKFQQAQYWETKHKLALDELISREARTHMADNVMRVAPYRRSYRRGIEVRSQVAFDTRPDMYG